MDFAEIMGAVRAQAPLVQCITNIVTVNDCANVVLAAGGSPFMSDDKREVAETAAGVHALVCNLGAIDKTKAMLLAGRAANKMGHPVVLDPVAAGGTKLRQKKTARLLQEVHFAAIRGNASEILGIASILGLKKKLSGGTAGHGVDVSAGDEIAEGNLSEKCKQAKALARKLKTVIAVSGVIDIVTDGKRTGLLRNGCATMSRITGSGCMLTSLVGAFCGAMPDRPFEATVGAAALLGVAGDKAEKLRLQKGTGTATFRNDLIDAVFTMTGASLQKGVRYEER